MELSANKPCALKKFAQKSYFHKIPAKNEWEEID